MKRTKATGHALKHGVRQANAVTCGSTECYNKNLRMLAHELYMKGRTSKKKYNPKRQNEYTPKIKIERFIYTRDDINARRRARYNKNVEAIRLKRRVKKNAI